MNPILLCLVTIAFTFLALLLIERTLVRGGMYGGPYKVPRRDCYHDRFFTCLWNTIRIFTWLKLTCRNPLAIPCALIFVILMAGCSGSSPFEPKSTATAGDGKIPVSATVSATATGSTASNQPTDYTGGVAVTFGADVAQPDRQAVYDTAHASGLTINSLSTGPIGSGVKVAFSKAVDSVKKNDFLARLYKKKTASGGSFWAHLFGTDAAADAYSPVADGPYTQPGSNLMP